MTTRVTPAHAAMLLLVLMLAACASNAGTEPTPGASPSSPAPSSPAPSSPMPSPTSVDGALRVLITCFYPDGSEVGTFTRLEEAWASTNYVRIDRCEAAPGPSGDVELTDEEESVAEIAAADLPDEDPADLFLRTLAACVRIPSAGEQAIANQPTSLLEATLALCPEAPQAGLVEAELETRG